MWILILGASGLALVAVSMMVLANVRAKNAYATFVAEKNNVVPTFTELQSGYRHAFTDHNAQPMMDLIVFDPKGDGSQAVMVTGAKGQPDGVLIYEKGSMKNVAKELGLEGQINDSSYGLAAADIDGDGLQEVIVARQTGVYIYSRTQDDPMYTETKVDLPLPPDATAVDVAVSDTTKNGFPDLFLSTFIDHSKHSTANFNDPAKRVPNVFWRNNGDGTFRDASVESGLDLHHNTFMATFVDLNGNGFDDLVLATNTAEGFVYENLGDGTFKKHKLPIGYGFWMGVGIADVTGNTFPDIYLSNAGTAIPAFMMKGDLTNEQKLDTSFRLLENDGKFNFRDVTQKYGLANAGFGWGTLFADFTNNGVAELVITENFIGMPMKMHKIFPSKGSFYVRGQDGKYFNTVVQSGLVNKNFGYRAVALDLNGNGFKDLVTANIDGPLRIFMNDGATRAS